MLPAPVAFLSRTPWHLQEPAPIARHSATSGFVEALAACGVSLLVSSRQASRVITLFERDGECLSSSIRSQMPMGSASSEATLALGTATAIRIYQRIGSSGDTFSRYIPSNLRFIGATSVHDVGFGEDGEIWFVNTTFSSICRTDALCQFKVVWRPSFIERNEPFDHCHLNGMAMEGLLPRFATALAETSTPQGWRQAGPDRGVLIDMQHGVLTRHLSLPHSPRLFDGSVYLAEAGRGLVTRVSPISGQTDVVAALSGVIRGLDFSDKHIFVGTSKLRGSGSDLASELSGRLRQDESARIFAIDRFSGSVCGFVELDIDEISSLSVLGQPRAALLDPSGPEHLSSFFFRY